MAHLFARVFEAPGRSRSEGVRRDRQPRVVSQSYDFGVAFDQPFRRPDAIGELFYPLQPVNRQPCVLRIGGVKEKALAARRAGINRVILPRENQKDLRELPDNVRAEMEFVFADRVEEVLTAAIPDLAPRLTMPKAA